MSLNQQYAATLGDLLLRQGDQQAQNAREQARLGQVKGQLWGNFLGGVANLIQEAPERDLQQKERAARIAQLGDISAERKAKAQALNNAQAAQQALADAMRDPANGGDLGKVADVMDRAGHPDLATGLRKQASERLTFQTAMTGAKDAQRQRLADRLSLIADPNNDAEGLAAIAGMSTDGVSQDLIEEVHKGLSGPDPAAFVKQYVAGSPEGIKATRAQQAEAMKVREIAPGAAVGSTATGFTLPNPKPVEPPKFKPLEQQYAEATTPEERQRLLGLMRQEAVARHVTDPRPAAASGGIADVPGDWDKTGEDFLKSIPPQWRSTVRKIAAYDEDPTKVASMRGGMRETLMQWVNQVNPAYDQSQFALRAPTKKAFTIGTQGQQINAINTALGHIDQLTTLSDQIQNGGFTPSNKAWNTIRTMFGSDKVTNFDTLKDALAGEVSSVLAKGGATVSGIAEAKEKINAANSPKQLAGYVNTLIPVMGSKLAELNYQYHQAMGENDPYSALSPSSEAILRRMGFDPAHPEVGSRGSSPAVDALRKKYGY